MGMPLGENARMAFNNVRENKMRSLLTVLGVVIGVTALITVSSVLVGLDASIRDYLSEFGSDTIFIFKFRPGHPHHCSHSGRIKSQTAHAR